jgi:type II secretory pathway pseudopilin PulG
MEVLRATQHRSAAGQAGFTLVEVVLGGALLAGLLLVAGLGTDQCLDMLRQRQAAETVSSNASRALQKVASELAFARRDTLQPAILETQGSSSITFQRSLGVNGGAVQWSPRVTLAWELDPGEVDDGVDNDGDGLVDEGELVWTENPGLANEQRVVLAHGLAEFLPGETFDGLDEDGDGLIDERGATFFVAGDVVRITLGLQGAGPSGRVITKVVETSVAIRN